jgi:hypothetical protein
LKKERIMKLSLAGWSMILGLILGGVTSAQAVTVYFKDGTQLEVENVSRVGNRVCLMVDIDKLDTARTPIENLGGDVKVQPEGLVITDVDFSPSDDNTEIIGTGKVVNHQQFEVRNVQVTAILKDKNDKVLLTIQGHVQPDTLKPGQSGAYFFRVQKPTDFWKASVEVQSEALHVTEPAK